MLANCQARGDLFNAVRMGYVVVESNKLDNWKQFLQEGIGMHLAHADVDGLAFRMDDRARRFLVQRGPAEDVVAVGLEIASETALEAIVQRLHERNIAFQKVSSSEATWRGVQTLLRVKGPKGLAIELFTDPVRTNERLNMLTSGFVTGDGGFGHVAITSRLPEKVQRFWQELFDARLSDHISQRLAGVMLDITFLRFNERHHSVAIATTRGLRVDPVRTKVQHINMVANSLADVTGAFTRLHKLGYEMAHEIGQHPNDFEISFYVFSPSGFEIELGCDALKVDETIWKPAQHYAISAWGHKPEKSGALNHLALNLSNALRGVRSLLEPEYSPIL